MNSAKLTLLLCLIVTMWPRLCVAELLPGDIALTRVQGNVVSIMALRNIPAGEKIRFTDDHWINGSFDRSGATGEITIGDGGLLAGRQKLIDLSSYGITLEWKDTLHFFQVITPSYTTVSHVRHLLLIEFNQDGLRWRTNIPDGLIRDVTHITIRERFTDQGMDHVIHENLLAISLTPYKWLSALGSFRAWQSSTEYTTRISMGQWSELQLNITPSPGIISLPFSAQNYSENLGQIQIPVRRCFGSTGRALVNLSVTDKVPAFRRWQNQTVSGQNMDLTDVAFGIGKGFVAVSPNSGTILLNSSGTWDAKDTNDTPGLNLQLCGIIHDGSAFRACSSDGRIYKSDDGVNWGEVYVVDKPLAQFYRIHYLSGAGFPYVAVGRNGLCAFSADGEKDWVLGDIRSNTNLFGAAFFGGRYVLCGEGGLIIHADSPGGPWITATTPDARHLYSIAKVDAGGTPALLAVGQYGTMLSTLSLENKNPFVSQPSNTVQSLFDIVETSLNEGKDKYIFAVGSSGVAVLSKNGAPFITTKRTPRAPALYALARNESGTLPVIYGVGEYGSLIRFLATDSGLSGSVSGIDLDGQGSSVQINWEDGDSSEQYIKLTKGSALSLFRERLQLQLERPASPGSGYHLGNDESEVNFFKSAGGGKPPVADNFGPLLKITDSQLEVLNDDEWRLSFRILNTSRRSSQDLFIRFDDTNLPDYTIPDSATVFAGSGIGRQEQSSVIQIILREPVETIGLYEVFRTGEEVLKVQVAINSLAANSAWVPNGIFPRSLGSYLLDSGNLGDPGIPGVGILGGGGGNAPPAEQPLTKDGEAPPPIAYGGSGFVFSGSVPTPPDNNPESAELVLLSVGVSGPIEMDVRATYNYFLEGGFYNTGTGLLEDYTMNTVDWAVTQSAVSATGLSIKNDTGTFVADAYPGVQYPRNVSMDAATTEGAPLDGGGKLVEYTDSQGLKINEPAANRSYAEWVASKGLAADQDDENQDADADGIVNQLEYILGTNPKTANQMSGISQSYDANTGRFTFRFTIPNDLSQVMLKIKASSDLSTWTEQTMTRVSSDSTTETWSATVSMGTKGFGKLQVETYTPTP